MGNNIIISFDDGKRMKRACLPAASLLLPSTIPRDGDEEREIAEQQAFREESTVRG